MNNIKIVDSDVLEFFAEARDLLQQAEDALLKFEKGNVDFNQTYNLVFRAFHSVKGASGMLGLSDLQSHMHQIETLLSECKKVQQLTTNEITFFISSIDATLKYFDGSPIENFDYNVKTTSTTPPRPSPSSSESKNIKKIPLVYAIDDEPDILEILRVTLKMDNIDCMTFSNIKELIQQTQKTQPHVVLSDMQMPEVSGLDVLHEIKKINADIPVIFISGYLTKDILIQAISTDGLFAAIEKPFDNDSTINTIRKAIKKSETTRLLDRTINLLLYQLPELSSYLKNNNKADLENTLRTEINDLVQIRRTVKGS